MEGGPKNLKTIQGQFFLLRPLLPPPPAFQTSYVFIQKEYVFPTLLLKKFLPLLLVGHKPFQLSNGSKIFKYTTCYYN